MRKTTNSCRGACQHTEKALKCCADQSMATNPPHPRRKSDERTRLRPSEQGTSLKHCSNTAVFVGGMRRNEIEVRFFCSSQPPDKNDSSSSRFMIHDALFLVEAHKRHQYQTKVEFWHYSTAQNSAFMEGRLIFYIYRSTDPQYSTLHSSVCTVIVHVRPKIAEAAHTAGRGQFRLRPTKHQLLFSVR